MNVSGAIYVGWRYLQRQRRKAVLLIAAITLSLFLPLGISRVVREAEHHLRARSAATPLLLGAPGSPLELVFNGIYFSEPEVEAITYGQSQKPRQGGLARVIPIHARYEARGFRIVGTSLEYFRFRDLEFREGRAFGRLGDCVLGSAVAKKLGMAPDDRIVSTPAQLFDLAGVYPLRMRVTGVLRPTGTVDDRAVFIDVKTAWIIEGIAHGHEDAEEIDDDTVLDQEGSNTALNASVREYTEITDENIQSFHFHGDPSEFPVTSAIVLPRDGKAETILLGRYLGENKAAQMVRPDDVMENLFATVFQIRNFVVAALAAVGVMAAAIAALVFLLSNRLRAREFASLVNLGADPASVRMLVAFEAVFVVVTSVALAGAGLLVLDFAIPRLLPMLTA